MRALISALILAFSFGVLTSGLKAQQRITPSEVRAVAQAITDEIYDYGYESYGFDYVGKQIAQGVTSVRVYIEPTLRTGPGLGEVEEGLGYVIYKYMPFGEVLRLFWFNKKGLAILGGNPELGFPPENPNYLTVYMDDDELCRDKATWLKASFVIRLHPSTERLREAAERQKERIGYSVRLDPSRRIYAPGHDPRCAVN